MTFYKFIWLQKTILKCVIKNVIQDARVLGQAKWHKNNEGHLFMKSNQSLYKSYINKVTYI